MKPVLRMEGLEIARRLTAAPVLLGARDVRRRSLASQMAAEISVAAPGNKAAAVSRRERQQWEPTS